MTLVPRVLALRAVGQNQVISSSIQQSSGSLLNPLGGERHLLGSVIEVRHLTLRPQSLQDPAELRRAVWIRRPAQGHDAPDIFQMGQYVAAAPECFVVRVGDHNGSPAAKI
jgi:hypothetical protein